jgi:hypothetical protein
VQANGVVKVHFEREWLSRSPADREVAAAVEHAFRGTCAFDIPPDVRTATTTAEATTRAWHATHGRG